MPWYASMLRGSAVKLLDTTDTSYRLEHDGTVVEYPRVTAILSVVQDFSAISPERLAYAAERGKAVHRAIWLLEAGGDGTGLAWDTVHPELVPYLTAYQAFKKGTGCRIVEKERLIVSERYRYAGRADLVVEGLEKWSDMLDIKTGEPNPAHALQLAAYVWGYREMGNTKRILGRCVLYLRDNATYRLVRHHEATDFNVFLAVKQVYDWRRAHES